MYSHLKYKFIAQRNTQASPVKLNPVIDVLNNTQLFHNNYGTFFY